MGRAHKGAKATASVRCPNCSGIKLPHSACAECGYVRPGLRLNFSKED